MAYKVKSAKKQAKKQITSQSSQEVNDCKSEEAEEHAKRKSVNHGGRNVEGFMEDPFIKAYKN